MDLLPKNDFHRKIIHLDMDAFYASVEMRDNPALKNKALVIAHDPREYNGHGVVATANYLARQYGINSAMPAIEAVKRIPKDKLVFVTPNFDKYRQVSAQVHEIMHAVTDQVESVALDEAYMDVTSNKLGNYSAIELGSYMQERIYKELQLGASFGVSYNKFLAKMGSEYAKPFGRSVILSQEALTFLADQPIKKFPGVGKKTQGTFQALGLKTGKDLQKLTVKELTTLFGKFGYQLALHAHGIDFSPVKAQRKRKSIGKENTFLPVLFDQNEILRNLRNFAESISKQLKEKKLQGKVVTIKVRTPDFVTKTKRKTLSQFTNDEQIIYQASYELLNQIDYRTAGIRLLGISVSQLENNRYTEINLGLFSTDW